MKQKNEKQYQSQKKRRRNRKSLKTLFLTVSSPAGFIQFLMKEVGDSYSQLLDNGVRMLLQLLTAWKNALTNTSGTGSGSGPGSGASKRDPGVGDLHHLHLHQVGLLKEVYYRNYSLGI